jgi:gamma-glutamyltranspeptidase/glutathione hydrolase
VFGDPRYVDVPVTELTDPATNADIAATISDETVLAAGRDPHGGPAPDNVALAAGRLGEPSDGNTTHITVVDDEGTVVSMTNSIMNLWGSGQEVGGFFVNDLLLRFSLGGEANTPGPGRRPVSWDLPLIVLDDTARPVLGLGSPGGSRIATIESNVLVRWGLSGMSLADAVQAPRVHLINDDELVFETLPDDDVAADLRSRGYADLQEPDRAYYFGSVQALEIDHETGTVTGAADPRRNADWDSTTR